jgi:hypothetical protein
VALFAVGYSDKNDRFTPWVYRHNARALGIPRVSLEVLTIRGCVTITEIDGIRPEYAASAQRYLGEEAAKGYLHDIDQSAPGWRRSTSAQSGSARSTSRRVCPAPPAEPGEPPAEHPPGPDHRSSRQSG